MLLATLLSYRCRRKQKERMCCYYGSKEKQLRMNTETSNNNPRNLEKGKRKKINNLEIITKKNQLDNNRIINPVEKDLIYLGSNRNLIKSSILHS